MQRRYQQTPDWSHINPDLLECILKKLPLPAVIRCRSVCSNWRSTTKAILLSPPNPPPPMLMLRRKFHNLFGEEDYLVGGGGLLFLNLAAPAQAPGSYAASDEDHLSSCVPSFAASDEDHFSLGVPSHAASDDSYAASYEDYLSSRVDLSWCVPMGRVADGWMVYRDTDTDRWMDGRLYLVNPSSFGSVNCLRLPPIEYPRTEINYYELERSLTMIRIPEKVVFWGNPVFGGECRMAILCDCSSYPERLYFAISEGGHVHVGLLSDSGLINDIICVNNRVYGVTSTGYIQAWDCSGDIRKTTTWNETTATTTTVTTYDVPTRTTTVVKTTDSATITTVTNNDAPIHTANVVETTNSTTVKTFTITTVTKNDAPNLIFSFQPKIDRDSPLCDTYLVESEGEVLLVSRNTRDMFKSDPRKKFAVYKLDLNLKRWMTLYSLGDRVLLMLCERQNMSLSTTEFPNYERNAIYFVVSGTIYVFNMEDGSVKEAGSGRMITDEEEVWHFWTRSSIPLGLR